MSPITTHVLDTARGTPARGIRVTLERQVGDEWRAVAHGVTNADGRVNDLLPEGSRVEAAVYRLVFETGAYFAGAQVRTFYPVVQVVFEIRDPEPHTHVPLLLSPFGYSTYRGS